jgi:alkanesulfonate monooxygenase SsuD/methylene tetrahydromethanopterin reductase-like flavin-dependent oxidoreductase (luciferase family)
MAISVLRLDMRAPASSPARAPELYAAALDMAAFVDERGFDLISLSEHHGVEDGYLPSPIAMAGCIAGRTRRVRIGVIALLLPLYDPIKLAEDLVVLDLASGGRVSIVAGLGYRPDEYEMLGIDWASRGRRMDESLEALVGAWKGEPFTYRGREIQLTPRPLSESPPVSVGGTGRNAARRAARFGLPFQPSVDKPEIFSLYRDECLRLGVEHPLAIPPGSGEMIIVSEDPDRSWTQIGEHLLYEAQSYASWQPEGQRSAVHSFATNQAELRAEGRFRILTPDECIVRAKQRGPFADFVLYPLCGGTPPEHGWRSLELYADRVMPHLAG